MRFYKKNWCKSSLNNAKISRTYKFHLTALVKQNKLIKINNHLNHLINYMAKFCEILVENTKKCLKINKSNRFSKNFVNFGAVLSFLIFYQGGGLNELVFSKKKFAGCTLL